MTVNTGSSIGTGALTLFQTSTNNTVLTLSNSAQTVGSLSSQFTANTGTQTQTITLNGTALTVNQTVDGTYGTGAVSTLTSTITGTGSIIKQGSATLTLTGANTYSGGTTLNAGTLNLGSAGAIGSAGTITFGGGTLQYSASNSTDYSARFSTAGSQSLKIDTNGQNVVYASALTGSSSLLTKLGTGTLTLTGVNTYSGTTTVNAGSLLATNSSGSATGTGIVNVNSGGLLGGTGSVGGAVTVASGGTVRGDSGNGVGTLALGSSLTIASDVSNGGKIQSTVSGAPGVGNSKLTFSSGTLTLGDGAGTFTIDLRQGAVAVSGGRLYAITLATATNGGLFKLGNTTLIANDVVSQSRYTVTSDFQSGFTGNYVLALDNTGNNLQLTFTPVPEPGTMVALGAAGLGLLGAFRRYRNRKVAIDLAA